MESSKPSDLITPKMKEGVWESQMLEDELTHPEESYRSVNSSQSDGEKLCGNVESAPADIFNESLSTFETLFSDKSSGLYYDACSRKLSPLNSSCLTQTDFCKVDIDPTKISHGCHSSQGIEKINNGHMYSCKHIFPFKTIKSYPIVYHSSYRGNLNKNNTPELKNAGGNKCSSSFPLSKYELLKKLDEADRAIAETEKKIETLKKVLDDYPQVGNSKTNIVTCHSQGERIYNENKIKAEASHNFLVNANKKISDLSKFQPNDLEILREICKRFKLFQSHLVQSIRERRQRELRTGLLAEGLYEARRTEWKSWIVMRDTSPERRRNTVERLQFFEKVFPELRLDREHKEIIKSASVRTRNHPYVRDYDLFLREKQVVNENAKMLAANISKLLPPLERVREAVKNENLMRNQQFFINHEFSIKAPWLQQEKELFKEKFLEHPKNFSVIASFFKDKSISDCIEFYYATKKEEHYKELVSLKDGRRSRGCRPERGLLKCRASEFQE